MSKAAAHASEQHRTFSSRSRPQITDSAHGLCRNLLRLFVLLTLISPAVAEGATLPSGFTETLIAQGLTSPTAMAFAPDGRLFVCLQGGQVRVVKNGTLLAAPFVTITVHHTGERGLLGIAFDPNFAANNFVYVYYTVPANGATAAHNRVSRFTAAGELAAPGSEVLILRLDDLSNATNHNGGAMHFGKDGKLYIAVGDNANSSNAQSLTTLHGKMLRINANGSIPTDNPFLGATNGKNQTIWALGFRNPFTFEVHPISGRIFINDVGNFGPNQREEINDGVAGGNYGWPQCEGVCSNPNFRNPVYAYPNSQGCAITGGAFYSPAVSQFPADYVGKYFFADFCGGWIRRLDPSDGTVTSFAGGISSPVDLKVGPEGGLYYLARGGGGVIYRITHTEAPAITSHPASLTVLEGHAATFTVTASGTTPLQYQWQRNAANISGATSSSYTLPSATVADGGAQFRCVVTNALGSATSDGAVLTVVANRAPALLTEENSQRAAALASVTSLRDPFVLPAPFNFSADQRTRVMLFAVDLNLLPGEGASAVTVRAEGAQGIYTLPVEHVGRVPNFDWLTQVTVRLPDEIAGAGDVQVSISLRGMTSNRALLTIR
ncbi:MAG: PQQ-dependent sugar dehydrogenase [Pyrinomonadaceae bacterium]